ncbi:MAG: DUF1572 family protein [Cyclobacteriaceae bacterium]|nr:DUF1572 family protein [Cyclobacteriaceae bacterium]
MLNNILADFYERDINKMIEEINAFKKDENIWRTSGTIKNSCGNLVLHIIGGTNYLIGKQLGKTDFIRNRDNEFIEKNLPRDFLISELEKLKILVRKIFANLTEKEMESDFPITFDNASNPTNYVLIQLLAHLNYHLGQINYLRRALE